MKNSLLRVALFLAMLTATTTFGGSQRWICRETGKEVDTCCCELKDGKFYCKLTKSLIYRQWPTFNGLAVENVQQVLLRQT